MVNDLNRVFLIGRLTKDADTRFTQSGTSCTSFSVANNKSFTKDGQRKDTVSFFNCIAWSKLGDTIAKYTHKGSKIALEGRLSQRSWKAQDGSPKNTVEIVVESVQFLDAKGRESDSSEADTASGDLLSSGTEQTGEAAFESQSPHFDYSDCPF